MGKYQYDKSILSGLGVSDFLNEVKLRERKIAAAPAEEIVSEFPENRVAARLHPAAQQVKVAAVRDWGGVMKTYRLVPDISRGCKSLAPFRAGQYITVSLPMNGVTETRRYTIGSDPAAALSGEDACYSITVASIPGGYAGNHIVETWEVGSQVTISAPHGEFYYQSLRDGKRVVGVCGLSVTVFMAMAEDLAAGREDYELVLLNVCPNPHTMLFREELEDLVKRCRGKFSVKNILLEGTAPDAVSGPLTADMIREAGGDGEYSVFLDAAKFLEPMLAAEVDKLQLPPRRVRRPEGGIYGDPARCPDYPSVAVGKTFPLHILHRGKQTDTVCRFDESLLRACEQMHIPVPTDCGGGVCGYCRSRLVSGDVFVPPETDRLRMADRKFGWIHPCISYPLSEITIEVFPTE